MNRDKLLSRICPVHRIYDCCNSDTNFDCKECKRVMNDWLDEYDKQIRADAIDEAKEEIVHHLNDYALQEAPIYQDDMANQRPVYLAIKNCINGVIEITEQLKEQNNDKRRTNIRGMSV